MLALALLPTLSHALAHARGGVGAWAEVCTPQGLRAVALGAGQGAEVSAPAVPAAPTTTAAGHLEHCPLCALNADFTPLPAPAQPALALPAGSAELPALFLHAPRTPFSWRSAQPRGPPSVS